MKNKPKKLLKEMIKEEALAPKDYMKLRKTLTSSRDKKVISGIISQERKHKQKLKKILGRY